MRLLSILTFLVLLASMKVPALRRGNDDEEHVGPFSRPASMKVPALRRGNTTTLTLGVNTVPASMKVPALRRGNVGCSGGYFGWFGPQ